MKEVDVACTSEFSSGPKTSRRPITQFFAAPHRGERAVTTESHRRISRRSRKTAAGSRQYLQPEPALQFSSYAKGQAQQGRSVPAYAYANNNPITNSDPTGLFVSHGSCANWPAAVDLAMKWAGCKGGGKGKANSNNECQYQQAVNGGCNICQFIEEGIGPDAFFRSMPWSAGSAHTNAESYYRSFSWHPEPNSVLFDDGLCTGSVSTLAQTIIHEASHFCAVKTGRPVPDGPTSTPGTGPYFGDKCASNAGGPCVP